MKVELLYLDGCPGCAKAKRSLEAALSQEDVESGVELVAVGTDEEAQRLGFPGSPTIRVDGRDLFPVDERDAWRLSCRVYATPDGPRDHPTVEMIRAALRRSTPGSPGASGGSGGQKSVEGSNAVVDAEDAWSPGLFGVPLPRSAPSCCGKSTGSSRCGSEVQKVEEKGEVKIERQEVVINEPFLTWPDGKR